MQANKIEAGKTYEITIGKNTTIVSVTSVDRRVNGQLVFDCMNAKTNKRMTVSDAKRFVKEIKDTKPKGEKKSLREIIESKGITIIPKGKRATNTMSDLDDPTFTRKHHVDENGVLVLEADDETENESKKECGRGGKPSGKMSALDAAHEILKEQNREMNVKEITELAISSGRWSPNGKTPVATLSAAIQMDVIKRQDASRFVKTGRGLFAAR